MQGMCQRFWVSAVEIVAYSCDAFLDIGRKIMKLYVQIVYKYLWLLIIIYGNNTYMLTMFQLTAVIKAILFLPSMQPHNH
jgi:hypothetical protein